MKNNRFVSFLIIAVTYILAGLLGYFLYPIIKIDHLMVRFLVLDLICTVFVYLVSMIFNNASVYDPYWSVAPMVILPLFMVALKAYHLVVYVIIILYFIWGIRLTANWAYGFKNLNHQDWRYQNFKEKHPKTFFLINLFGIHLFPTVIVFMGMLPGFYFMEKAVTIQLNFGVIFGFVMMLFATIIELVADLQMFAFRKKEENHGLVMNKGLWKISRHPNYFGEILFWISIWLCYFSVVDLGDVVKMILSAASPICIFIMFVFVSIPMLEKRQLKRRPGYKEYMDNTNMLLIYPLLKTKK